MANTTNRAPNAVASMASASCVPCHQLTTQPNKGAKHVSTRKAWRVVPRLRGTSSYHSRSCWRTVCSLRRMPVANRWLTALKAHERASTIPKLHRAKTVAWGLLKWDRCCMIVVSHWSKPAWQNMASLLTVVGHCIPHSMPYGGKSYHLIFKKPPLVSTLDLPRQGGGVPVCQSHGV